MNFLVDRKILEHIPPPGGQFMHETKQFFSPYRIEFQLCGMPHLHGVFWLNEREIQSCKNSDGEYINEKVVELIENWILCSLDPQDEIVYNLVKDVNVHHHTKSCQKGKTVGCRFNFP